MRKTTKYWVQTKDVLRVKMFILRNRPIYKFTPGASDADLVSSVYLDNERLEMYEGRLKKTNGALAIRLVRTKNSSQRLYFDWISERRTGAVRLDVSHFPGRHRRGLQRGAYDPFLGRGARGC